VTGQTDTPGLAQQGVVSGKTDRHCSCRGMGYVPVRCQGELQDAVASGHTVHGCRGVPNHNMVGCCNHTAPSEAVTSQLKPSLLKSQSLHRGNNPPPTLSFKTAPSQSAVYQVTQWLDAAGTGSCKRRPSQTEAPLQQHCRPAASTPPSCLTRSSSSPPLQAHTKTQTVSTQCPFLVSTFMSLVTC
jgi:hypothetical protein